MSAPPQLDAAYPDFGEDMARRLDQLVAESGLTPTAFARRAGLSLQTLQHQRRLAGRSMPALGAVA